MKRAVFRRFMLSESRSCLSVSMPHYTSISLRTAIVICEQERTSVSGVPGSAMSAVRKPFANTRETAVSMSDAASSSSNERRSIIAADSIVAMGFAISRPAMSVRSRVWAHTCRVWLHRARPKGEVYRAGYLRGFV